MFFGQQFYFVLMMKTCQDTNKIKNCNRFVFSVHNPKHKITNELIIQNKMLSLREKPLTVNQY